MLGQVAIFVSQRFPPMAVIAKWSPQDLSLPDEPSQLLDLRLGGHVHILVSNTDDHATQNCRVRLEGG